MSDANGDRLRDFPLTTSIKTLYKTREMTDLRTVVTGVVRIMADDLDLFEADYGSRRFMVQCIRRAEGGADAQNIVAYAVQAVLDVTNAQTRRRLANLLHSTLTTYAGIHNFEREYTNAVSRLQIGSPFQ